MVYRLPNITFLTIEYTQPKKRYCGCLYESEPIYDAAYWKQARENPFFNIQFSKQTQVKNDLRNRTLDTFRIKYSYNSSNHKSGRQISAKQCVCSLRRSLRLHLTRYYDKLHI